MAKFESRFGIGDHIWSAVRPTDNMHLITLFDCEGKLDPRFDGKSIKSIPPWLVYERIVSAVEFCECGVWYSLVGSTDGRPEEDLASTPEEAVEKERDYLIRREERWMEQELEDEHPEARVVDSSKKFIDLLKSYPSSYLRFSCNSEGEEDKNGVYVARWRDE